MISLTNTMKKLRTLLSICIFSASIISGDDLYAETINDTWLPTMMSEFGEPAQTSKKLTPLQIIIKRTYINGSRCHYSIESKPYRYNEVFQLPLKADIDAAKMTSYLFSTFGFHLKKSSLLYKTSDSGSDCNDMPEYLIQDGDLIIGTNSGYDFLLYKRKYLIEEMSLKNNEKKALQQYSQLPFDMASYIGLCLNYFPMKNGIPLANAQHKCEPVYYPIVADSSSKDDLSKIVGSHLYVKGGMDGISSSEYDNPVKNGLHPIYLIFKTHKDVILARVTDSDRAQDRDIVPGAYISIKNGKVVDQLNEGCNFDEKFVCSSSNSKQKYRLTESGKFLKLP